MKKLITSIIIVFTCLNSFCLNDIGFEVILYKNGKPIDTNSSIKPHSVVSYPHVINENGTIVITSSRLIENAHIIITDCNGAVIIDEVSSLTNAGVRLQLPDTDEGGMYKIEIEYGDTYLYGFIN